jgi:hypothetical protein
MSIISHTSFLVWTFLAVSYSKPALMKKSRWLPYQLLGNPLNAQSGQKSFREILCTKLEVYTIDWLTSARGGVRFQNKILNIINQNKAKKLGKEDVKFIWK